MTYRVPDSFLKPWRDTPMIFIDFETTGLPPIGRAVEVGLARFEHGVCVGRFSSFINPQMPIPAEATAIHGITDDMVKDARTAAALFASPEVVALCEGAQPGAFNSSFDRLFLPMTAPIDHSWPFLDSLVLARNVDRYVKGTNKNKLVPTCERHGVKLEAAHRAGDDAQAAGELFHVLIAKLTWADNMKLGELLHWTREEQNNEWHRFNTWLGEKQLQEST